VTAVVVTRGPTDYLPRTLAGLSAQTRLPDVVVLVDAAGNAVGLDDGWDTGSGRLTPVSAPGARTFGAAVRAGLADVEPSGGWLWLLHDDSAPDPTALANLLRAVEHAPSVGVAGCKQRTWGEPARVVEAGVTTSRFGRRMSGLDGPEVDQGQHDAREDVLAVGTAGALVRRDVWDALGGTDPALGPYGDGLDLCRRARLAGHRVVVVPSAVVRHAQASLHRGRREWDAGRSSRARREAYVHSQLAGGPVWAVPIVAVLAVVSGVVRALGRIATKEPDLVAGELLAPWRVLARPGRILRARRSARATRVLPRRALRPLEATWRDVVGQLGDRRMVAMEQRRSRRAPSELEIAELAALRLRRRATLAAVLVVAIAVDLAVLGTLVSRVLGGDRLVGGTLAFGDAGPGELWAAATSWWAGGGYGQAAPPDPFLVVLVPLTALVGTVGRAAAVVLLGAFVLAAVGAWFAAGAVTRSVALRTWAVLVWLGAPALLVSVEQARLGAVLAHAVLPWFLLGLARGLGAGRIDVVESGLVGAARLARRPEDEAATEADVAPEDDSRTATADTQESGAEGWADEWPDDGRWPGDQVTPRDAVLRSAVEHAKIDATVDAVAGSVAGGPTDEPTDRPTDEPTDRPADEPTAAANETTDKPTAATDEPETDVGVETDVAVEPAVRRRPGAWATAEPSLAAAAGAALAFAVLTAAAPVLLPAGLLLLLAVAPVVRRRRRLLWLPLPALALHGPVVVAAVNSWDDGGWRLLVAEPGVPLGGAAAPAWQQVLGWPVQAPEWTAFGWPEPVGTLLPLVATGVILLLGVPALLLAVPRARAARVAWVAVAIGTAAALAASRVVTGVADVLDSTGAVDAVASAAPGISLALAGALLAALLAAAAVRTTLDRHTFGWRQVLVAVVALLAVLGPGVTLGAWTWQHRSGTGLAMATSGEPTVPAVGRQMQQSAGLRVLTLEATTDGVVAGVLAHDGRQMTEISRVVEASRGDDPARLEVADVAARLAAGATTDVSGDLVALGVGAVLIPPGAGPDRTALAARLDATAGLERVTATASGIIWRVTGATSAGWARVLDAGPGQDETLLEVLPADGDGVDLELSAGSGPRLLVLAERADSGWHAELAGEPLRAVETGWQQAFELPADGGRLVVEHAPVTRTPWLVLQAVVFGITLLLAVPVRRRRGAR
jgi:GT2 family glycosyltransferase